MHTDSDLWRRFWTFLQSMPEPPDLHATEGSRAPTSSGDQDDWPFVLEPATDMQELRGWAVSADSRAMEGACSDE